MEFGSLRNVNANSAINDQHRDRAVTVETTRHSSNDIDGGWAIPVLLSSFFANVIIFGIVNNNGIIYMELLTDLDAAPGIAAVPFAINAALILLASPVSAVLYRKIGPRPTLLISSILSSCGIILSGFVTNIAQLIITFGILTGFGWAVGHLIVFKILDVYFDHYRQAALVGVMIGMGIGSLVYPPFLIRLIETFHWRNAFLILGGVNLNLLIPTVVMKPLNTGISQSMDDSEHEQENALITDVDPTVETKTRCDRISDMFHLELLKNLPYSLSVLSHTTFVCGFAVCITHVNNHIKFKGFSSETAANAGIVLGITNCLGRVINTFMTHLLVRYLFLYYCAIVIIFGIAVCINGYLHSLILLMVSAGVIGLSSSAFCLTPPLVLRTAGADHFEFSFSFMLFGCGIAFLTGSPLAGWLFEMTLSYEASFLVAGILSLFGAVIILPYAKL